MTQTYDLTQLLTMKTKIIELNDLLTLIINNQSTSIQSGIQSDADRKLSGSFALMNMRIIDMSGSKLKLTHFFTTQNGSWESSNLPYGVEKWAWDLFMKTTFSEAGSSNHLFGAVIGLDGHFEMNQRIQYTWPGGSVTNDVKPSGWANEPIYGPGSSFVPERGESGSWSWGPSEGHADIILGGGLPMNNHVSSFAVWTRQP